MNQDNPGAGRLNSPSRPGNIPERFAAKRTTGMAQRTPTALATLRLI
jgi:hypothetical protein